MARTLSPQRTPKSFFVYLRLFVLVLTTVSLVAYKVVLLWSLQPSVTYFRSVGDFLWFPSLFVLDAAFVAFLVGITSDRPMQRICRPAKQHKPEESFKNANLALALALAILTSVLVSIEFTARWIHQLQIPWHLLVHALKNWSTYRHLAMAELNTAKGGWFDIWNSCVFLVALSLVVTGSSVPRIAQTQTSSSWPAKEGSGSGRGRLHFGRWFVSTNGSLPEPLCLAHSLDCPASGTRLAAT